MKLELFLKRTPDLEALDHGLSFFIHRVYARIRFCLPSGWGEERLAIIDTGAPYSTLPSHLWEPLKKQSYYSTQMSGIVPHPNAFMKATLAQVEAVVLDEQNVSPVFLFPAMLADTPKIPIILGFAQLLEKVKLIVDAPFGRAFLEL